MGLDVFTSCSAPATTVSSFKLTLRLTHIVGVQASTCFLESNLEPASPVLGIHPVILDNRLQMESLGLCTMSANQDIHT